MSSKERIDEFYRKKKEIDDYPSQQKDNRRANTEIVHGKKEMVMVVHEINTTINDEKKYCIYLEREFYSRG